MSSASTPSCSTIGTPRSRSSSRIFGSCFAISSGIGGLWALYAAYSRWRNVGPAASKTTATCSGRRSSSSGRSVFRYPNTALVTSPFEFRSGFLAKAKWDRYRSADPSTRRSCLAPPLPGAVETMAGHVAQNEIRGPVAHGQTALQPAADLGRTDPDAGRVHVHDAAAEQRPEGGDVAIPARDHDEARQLHDALGLAPAAEFLEAVLAHQEEEIGA